MEGAATTVYAQGGRGNSRLVAWEGERTVTFTMEDALISPTGFSILSGAGLVEASGSSKIKVHKVENVIAKKLTIDNELELQLSSTINGYKNINGANPYRLRGFTTANNNIYGLILPINDLNTILEKGSIPSASDTPFYKKLPDYDYYYEKNE
jgi:hypothetical protein